MRQLSWILWHQKPNTIILPCMQVSSRFRISKFLSLCHVKVTVSLDTSQWLIYWNHPSCYWRSVYQQKKKTAATKNCGLIFISVLSSSINNFVNIMIKACFSCASNDLWPHKFFHQLSMAQMKVTDTDYCTPTPHYYLTVMHALHSTP